MQPLIFLVDDDASVRSVLCRSLTAHGYRTMSFASAEEFLGSADLEKTPACLLLELFLPTMDGLSLQRAAGDRLVTIAMTARPDVASAVATLSAGAIDVLLKPISESSLLSAVSKALEQSVERFHQRREITALRSKLELLSPREREVMAMVADGLRNKVVADRLGIVEKTVKVHRHRLMQKLELDSLPALVRAFDRLKVAQEAAVL